MDDLVFLPAHTLARRIRRREVSALALLDAYLARVQRLDDATNAVVVLDVQRARQRAMAADVALARGDNWGPLHGVPMTVKESFNVSGLATTWGHLSHQHNIAQANAVAVQRLPVQ